MDTFKSITPIRVAVEVLPAVDKCLIRSSARSTNLILHMRAGCTKCSVAFKVRVANGYHILPCLTFVLRVKTVELLFYC